MKISVVIPANNEEHYIGKCLESVVTQTIPDHVELQIIVVLNRCTDRTEAIAKSFAATIVQNDAKNLSSIKNSGISVANGEWIITIDADSWMSENVLAKICQHARSKNIVGGGIKIRPERYSLGIVVGYAMMLVPAYFLRLSFGLYWFRKSDAICIGGFDESKLIAEDVDFLRRLKKHGNKKGEKHVKIVDAQVTTSCRKFDMFGDWHFIHLFTNPLQVYRGIKGEDQKYLDKNWYDVKK